MYGFVDYLMLLSFEDIKVFLKVELKNDIYCVMGWFWFDNVW